MSREILFRGHKDNGEWVYGDFEYNPSKDIARIHSYERGEYKGQIIVDKKTVGQFSGLCDKQGVKIFDGDIVKWDKNNEFYVVKFTSGMFYAAANHLNKNVRGGFPLWFLCKEEQHCSVVGNIHENNL